MLFNIKLNIISLLVILLILLIGIGINIYSSEDYLPPKSIDIHNASGMVNTRTDFPRSRDGLLIYTDKIIYRSSCLGLENFCKKGQQTDFEDSILIEFLLVSKTSRPEGIILKIINKDNNSIIFENDPDSVKSYLNGKRNIKYMFLFTCFVVICYLFLQVKNSYR